MRRPGVESHALVGNGVSDSRQIEPSSAFSRSTGKRSAIDPLADECGPNLSADIDKPSERTRNDAAASQDRDGEWPEAGRRWGRRTKLRGCESPPTRWRSR